MFRASSGDTELVGPGAAVPTERFYAGGGVSPAEGQVRPQGAATLSGAASNDGSSVGADGGTRYEMVVTSPRSGSR